MASSITFTGLDFTGTPNSDDNLAARYAVGVENKNRAAAIPPVAQLPVNNAAAVKSSYITVLLQSVTSLHNNNITASKSPEGATVGFTPDEAEQMRVNLVTRLNSGESKSSIIADTVS